MRSVVNALLERGRRVEAQDDRQIRAALLKRAALLPEQDRLLVELVQREMSRRRIAEILKMAPGTVCRRVRKLSQRLYDPLVLALLHESCPLEAQKRQMAVEYFLLGLTIRQLAQKHQAQMREVRETLDYVRGWHRGLKEGAQWRRAAIPCGR